MQFEKKSFDWKEEREGGGFGRAYIHNNKTLGSNRITRRKITQRQITTIRQDQTSTEFAPEQIREITDAS